MNVYDFDKTIYNGDSTTHFYFYCVKKQPRVLLWLPYQAWMFFLYIIGIYDKTQFKERFYSFFKDVKNIEQMVDSFWDTHESGIKKWYLDNHRDDDIVISASPEFLLQPICKRLGIKTLIASRVNLHDGKYDGLNCYGEEKVSRLKAQLGDIEYEHFYSDSLSDSPLAELAKNESYIVSGETLIKWNDYKLTPIKKLVKMVFDRQFLSFVFIGAVNTVNSVLFSILYSLLFYPNTAFVLGYITSLVISYLLNSFLTFKAPLGFVRFIKFAISYIPNFIIQNVIVFIVYNLLHLDELIAYILAGIIGIPVTFLMMKFFAFKNTKRP
ncbi:MAG: polysaccharide biosynthesis protein GtrA [Ruminococcaceae bacterium]|nr:polysaccharide biosynthesis protein GtrA [Oscillospiraceae bacterium]